MINRKSGTLMVEAAIVLPLVLTTVIWVISVLIALYSEVVFVTYTNIELVKLAGEKTKTVYLKEIEVLGEDKYARKAIGRGGHSTNEIYEVDEKKLIRFADLIFN